MTHREVIAENALLQPTISILKNQQGSDIYLQDPSSSKCSPESKNVKAVYKSKYLLEQKTIDNRATKKNNKKMAENKFAVKKMRILAKRVSRNQNSKCLKSTYSEHEKEYSQLNIKSSFTHSGDH